MRSLFVSIFFFWIQLLVWPNYNPHHQQVVVFVKGDFGDYADPTFNCPATTTCPVVCVRNVTACPRSLACATGTTLCIDGTCQVKCNPTVRNPCTSQCASVACQKTIDLYPVCQTTFAPQYEYENTCSIAEKKASINKYTYREPGFLLFYMWLICFTLAILLWCYYNNKISPIPGSTQPLKQSDHDNNTGGAAGPDASSPLIGWQTGYKIHPIGLFFEYATYATLLLFHILLAYIVYEYYSLKDNTHIAESRSFTKRFGNEEQVLKAFIITWSLGLAWSFFIKYPHSIRTVFLRRCLPSEATHIAVFITKERNDSDINYNTSTTYIHNLRKCSKYFVQWGIDCMSCIFSESNDRHDTNGAYQFCRVHEHYHTRYFVFMFRRYVFSSTDSKFIPGVWPLAPSIMELASLRSGLSTIDVEQRIRIVGPNTIEMQRPDLLRVMIDEVSKPMYSYQVFMIWSWMPINYYYMAVVWACVILSGFIAVTFFQYRNLRELYRVTHIEGDAEVLRDGQYVRVPQAQLVPGDFVIVREGMVYSDMVLMEATTVLVDESALTGEATPMAKTALDVTNEGEQLYDPKLHKRHTISAGTTVIECEATHALVIHTGSYTARGELLRGIFSFQRHQFKFDIEVGIVLFILFCYAIFGFVLVMYFIQESPVYGWFYGIYVVGTTIPPLLPTVFTVSVGISDDRLTRKRITCTISESILVAGKVTRAFFDKTGTLTRQGLDFIGARSAGSWNTESQTLSTEMALGMATCHGLTRTQGGHLIGNPVDRTMFEASGGTVNNASGPITNVTDRTGKTVMVVKHFDFDHNRMTQSVIVRTPEGSLVALVKGSAESIKKLCRKETLPSNYDEVVRDSAQSGVYQISMATKLVTSDADGWDVNSTKRDWLESDLTFVGVIDFKNVIRDETAEVIRQLNQGEVKAFMVTGDNVYTGISIAREAGIFRPTSQVLIGSVDPTADDIVWMNESAQRVASPEFTSLGGVGGTELAISGEAWSRLRTADPKNAARMAEYIRVYGRCTPFDKVSVVKTFIELGFITLACGDGGNDVGALKTAHVGIALSDAEASIVAPFTSLDKTITSVVEILKEGRCALASALATYKYTIMYGQIETMSQQINAYFHVSFSEWCWVFLDGVWTITMAFCLPLAQASDELSPTRPTASLLGPHTMASTLGVLVLNYLFTFMALGALFNQSWFSCRKWTGGDLGNVQVIGDNYEAQVVFLVTGYQYISSAMAYNFGYEFRQGWLRNRLFVLMAVGFTVVHFYATLVPGRLSCIWRVNCENEYAGHPVTSFRKLPIQNPFNSTVMPADFRWTIALIMVVNAVAVSAYDYFVVNGIRRRLAAKRRLHNVSGDPSDLALHQSHPHQLQQPAGEAPMQDVEYV